MLSEKKYYPVVGDYIAKRFGCNAVSIGKGYQSLGLVDVIGAYETSSSYYSDIEVVVAEVKTSIASFGKSIGQILGYSVFGERCYLAVTFKKDDTFKNDQIYLANHLGVGLIRIPVGDDGAADKSGIEVVLSSKKHEPIDAQKYFILHAIGITKCAVCGVFTERNKVTRMPRLASRAALFTPSIVRKMYICESCGAEMLTEKMRTKAKNRLMAGKKAALTRKSRKEPG